MNEWNSLATVPHQETGLIRCVLLFRVVMFFFHSPMSEEEKKASGIIIVKCVKIKGLRQRRDATLPTRSLWYVDETFTVKSSSLKTWPVGYGRLRDALPTTWTRRPIFFFFAVEWRNLICSSYSLNDDNSGRNLIIVMFLFVIQVSAGPTRVPTLITAVWSVRWNRSITEFEATSTPWTPGRSSSRASPTTARDKVKKMGNDVIS